VKDKLAVLSEIEKMVKEREKAAHPKPDTPITKLEEVKRHRTKRGKGQMVLCGIPWDVHAIESYILKISPLEMKTILRYDAIRNIEMTLNNKRPHAPKGSGISFTLIIVIVIIIAVAAFAILFGPMIMDALGGLGGVVPGG